MKTMGKLKESTKQPQFKAKLFGVPLIALGIILVLLQTELSLKIGFSCILIGLFMIVMITEKTIPELISNAQIKGHSDAIRNITTQLNLKGNAVFIPSNNLLKEERVFIPLHDSSLEVPPLDDDLVFATGSDGTSLGVALPPSGLSLLHEVEKNISFLDTNIDIVEEKLQAFVGMDILRSVSLKKKNDRWLLVLEPRINCAHDPTFCKQYPCPSCSAVLTAISKATNEKVHIYDAVNNGKKTTFYFTMMR
jgi:hypothetical protein